MPLVSQCLLPRDVTILCPPFIENRFFLHIISSLPFPLPILKEFRGSQRNPALPWRQNTATEPPYFAFCCFVLTFGTSSCCLFFKNMNCKFSDDIVSSWRNFFYLNSKETEKSLQNNFFLSYCKPGPCQSPMVA